MARSKYKTYGNPGNCVYCGRYVDAVKREHVFPRSIFVGQLDPDMITVPACKACNDKKGLGDRDLRNSLVLSIPASDHRHINEALQRMMEHEPTKRWAIHAAHTAEHVPLVTKDGFVVGSVPKLQFNTDRIDVAQRMVLRALWY